MVTTKPAHYRKADLTRRQREVLDLLARGRTNPQIADHLGITLDGAKYHVSEVMARLNVDSREEAADWWREQNSVGARFGAFFAALARPALVARVLGAAGIVVVAAAGVALAAALLSDEQEREPLQASSAAPEPAPGTIRWATLVGPEGGPYRVSIGGTDGGALDIDLEGEYAHLPAWSPDGLSLAVITEIYRKFDPPGDHPEYTTGTDYFLRIVDIATGQVTSVPVSGNEFAWSPDSQVLAVLQPTSMVFLDRAGVVLRQKAITPHNGSAEPLIWSSDSQTVAVAVQEQDGATEATSPSRLTLVSQDGSVQDKAGPGGPLHPLSFNGDTIIVVNYFGDPPRPIWSWDSSDPSADWISMSPQESSNITGPSKESFELAQQAAGVSIPWPAASWNAAGHPWPYHVQQSGATVFSFGTPGRYETLVTLVDGVYELVDLPAPIPIESWTTFVLIE